MSNNPLGMKDDRNRLKSAPTSLTKKKQSKLKIHEDVGTLKKFSSNNYDFTSFNNSATGVLKMDSLNMNEDDITFIRKRKKMTTSTSMKAEIRDLLQLAIIKRKRQSAHKIKNKEGCTPTFRVS
mmetsp:Transcript_6189/g.5782  ORF Transcript_6189/g.5782 Transcript_6189/m.5782 type:complete len:124 (-) Transcript_6189:55-426(-)